MVQPGHNKGTLSMPTLVISIDGAVIKEVQLAKERTTLGRRPYNDIVIDNRSEEHTSELQSPCNLVCRLLLEKKKKQVESLSRAANEHRVVVHCMTWIAVVCA